MAQVLIVSGLSGSGKSTALNALEDLDFYCIDNLPIRALEKFLDILSMDSSEISRLALVMDLRDQHFENTYKEVFPRILANYENAEILFLDASDECLTRRFSETRRKHPASPQSVAEGIKKERSVLQDLREMASQLVDTSEMTVHQLKKKVSDAFGKEQANSLQVNFVSFGFKYGSPNNCDIMLDVRFLSNPHFDPQLRNLSGLDAPIEEFILNDARASGFIEKTVDYLSFLIPQYLSEGKRYLGIAIGCTGGKHRSVYVAKRLSERLQESLKGPYHFQLEHQHIDRSKQI